MALVQKETIPFAGCVTLQNKFKNEFAEIQAPQEIAGFFILRSFSEGGLIHHNLGDDGYDAEKYFIDFLCNRHQIESNVTSKKINAKTITTYSI